MHKALIVAGVAAAYLTSVHAVSATDILSHDLIDHELIITEDELERSVELAAMGEIRDICNGCIISLEDGQTVIAKENDVIAIIEGKLVADE